MYKGKDEFYKNYLIYKHGTPEERERALKHIKEVEHIDLIEIMKHIEAENKK